MFLARAVGGDSKRTEQQYSHFDVGYIKVNNKCRIAMSHQIFLSYSVG